MISRHPFQPQLLCDFGVDTSTHVYLHPIYIQYTQPLSAWTHSWVAAQQITIHQLMPVKLTRSSAESLRATQCKPLLLRSKISHFWASGQKGSQHSVLQGWAGRAGLASSSTVTMAQLASISWQWQAGLSQADQAEPCIYRFSYRDLCSLELWGEEVKVCLTWPERDSNPCKEMRYRPVLPLAGAAGAYFTSTSDASP